MSVVRELFGPGAWGVGGNIVAWALCGALGLGWLHAKEKAWHVARMAQAATHHAKAMQLAADQHKALVQQANCHHAEAVDLAAAHHEALKAHVTATAAPRPAGPELGPL